MKKTLIIAGLAFSLIGGSAVASADDGEQKHQRKGHHGMKLFQEADVNGDKVLTRDEFTNAVLKKANSRFDKMDRNGDGVLSREDRKGGREHTMGGATGSGD